MSGPDRREAGRDAGTGQQGVDTSSEERRRSKAETKDQLRKAFANGARSPRYQGSSTALAERDEDGAGLATSAGGPVPAGVARGHSGDVADDIELLVDESLRSAPRRRHPLPALAAALDSALTEAGEMTLMGAQVVKSAVLHPVGYWGEVKDRLYDALKLCWVPLVFAVAGFGFGAPGLQGGNLLYVFGVPDRLGGFFMFATIREFGPFVEAMVVAGVVGTAMTADLGARRIREEIDAMEVLGVEPIRNLIVPRVISTALITMVFDLFALVLGIFSGFIAAVGFLGSTPSGYVASFFSESNIVDDWASLAKTLMFGLVIGLVCCYKGYKAKGGPAGVGRAVNQAVVISFAMIWVIDYAFTNIMLGYAPSVQVIK